MVVVRTSSIVIPPPSVAAWNPTGIASSARSGTGFGLLSKKSCAESPCDSIAVRSVSAAAVTSPAAWRTVASCSNESAKLGSVPIAAVIAVSPDGRIDRRLRCWIEDTSEHQLLPQVVIRESSGRRIDHRLRRRLRIWIVRIGGIRDGRSERSVQQSKKEIGSGATVDKRHKSFRDTAVGV